ncbi:hypothetical protein [Vibrio sp. qd031]|uniref:hypothetical protein n=1 Tax=Vibrio sp. qd031 TaxID=1603038 RepID=UPI00117BF5FD|nr:hypothetical protein [Vibrio sp. qd031]
MNSKIKPIALAIVAALTLAACNDDSTAKLVVDSEVDLLPATLNVGVKFPEPDVSAAWIGSDIATVEVKFFRNKFVGSLDEAEDTVDIYNDKDEDYSCETAFIGDQEVDCYEIWGGSVREKELVGSQVSLNADEKAQDGTVRTSVDLAPGKYRIEAHFIDHSGNLLETSVSYATLDSGNHTVSLRGASATWTVEGSPLELQLLNQAQLDTDWNPLEEGIQTPAEAMNITGAIEGVHLPSFSNFSGDDGNWRHDEYSSQVLTGLDYANMASVLVPVLRLDNNGTKSDSYPVSELEWEDTENLWSEFEISTSFAGHFQEYVDNTNNSLISLGSRSVYFNEWDGETGNSKYAELLLGTPRGEYNGDEDVYRDLYYLQENYSYYDSVNGTMVYTDLTIADIYTDVETDSMAELFFVTLGGESNAFIDGSTITGHLIEIVEEGAETQDRAIPAALLSESLEQMAANAGLIATSSNANNCSTTSDNAEFWFSNQYRWDEDNQQWVAGMINPLITGNYNGSNILLDISWRKEDLNYLINNEPDNVDYPVSLENLLDAESEFYALADLNGDGSSDLFEDGAFIDEQWQVSCSLNVSYNGNIEEFNVECTGLDVKTDVPSYQWSSEVTMCAQPFTLKASNLNIEYGSGGEIIID